MFARSHTDPTTLNQIVKKSVTEPEPIININKNEVLRRMRKKQYDFLSCDKVKFNFYLIVRIIC